jgi:hypothetical protein
MKNKCTRFYLINNPTGVQYQKLNSPEFFSKEEGTNKLREVHTKAKEIVCLNRKAVKMLKLKDPEEYKKLMKPILNK